MLENISYVADIVGVVLVVASLIYVAKQLHQNTEMLRSNARQAALGAELDSLTSMIDYPVNLVTLDEADLTETEKLRIQYMLLKSLRSRESYWFQRQSGILDEPTWESSMAPMPAVFSSNFARDLLRAYTGNAAFKEYLLE